MDPVTLAALITVGGSLVSGLMSQAAQQDEAEKNRRYQEQLAAKQNALNEKMRREDAAQTAKQNLQAQTLSAMGGGAERQQNALANLMSVYRR